MEHDGVVYHVQTEDKGLESPIILSLVYSGGAILASKRSPYQDLIASGFSDEVLAERLKRQHRLICAAIHSGRINDLKKMSSRTGETGALISPLVEDLREPEHIVSESVVADSAQADKVDATPVSNVDPDVILEDETPIPEIEQPIVTNIEDEIVRGFDAEPGIIHDLSIEQEIIVDLASRQRAKEEEALQIEPPAPEEIPDIEPEFLPETEAYTVYDPRRAGDIGLGEGDGIVISLLDDQEFYAGESRMLRVHVTERRGEKEKALANVGVSIKILGTAFRPLIYSVKTERDGVATVSTEIPQFNTGRAAVLIRVTAKESTAELRRVIHPVQTRD